jgi:DNA-binding transcriptional LysR family regulator
MLRDVELRELRIFLVLADELHFGRTAERLGISQPGVSEAVRVLESRLGTKVFDRTSRRVRLTPAGEALKRGLVPALAALDQALAQTSELSGAVRGLLRVGFVLTTEGPALSRLIAAFQARYPACEVRLQEVETFDAYRALRRGDIDVLCNWLAVDEPDLIAGTAFAHYQRALAVTPAHRLAEQRTVSIEDLADEEVAQLPPSIPSGVYDLLVPPRTPSGRPIRRTRPVQTINEILSLVARGRIVHPTSSTVPIFNRDDIALIPIRDLPPLPLGLVWSASRENPRIRALNQIASTMITAPAAQNPSLCTCRPTSTSRRPAIRNRRSAHGSACRQTGCPHRPCPP